MVLLYRAFIDRMKRGLMAAIIAALVLSVMGCTVEVEGSPRAAIGVMPNIGGMAESDALQALQEAGPWGYVLQEAPSDTVPLGRVVTFGPPAGTRLLLNRPVGVVVSSGPEKI